MSNNQIRPGYVPVTIELPAALAEKFRQQNYNWQPLIELIGGDCSSPFAIAETLLTLYFELTRLIVRQREELTGNDSELIEHLFTLEQLYRAMHAMSVSVATSLDAPVDALGQQS